MVNKVYRVIKVEVLEPRRTPHRCDGDGPDKILKGPPPASERQSSVALGAIHHGNLGSGSNGRLCR